MNMKTIGAIILAAALFLSATAPLPGAEPVKKKAAEGDKLFAQPQVLHLQIEISTANAALLKTDPKKYVRGVLREGAKVYAAVGIRLKGSESFQPFDKKPGLAVKFNEYVPGTSFHGQKKILLNNCLQDPTCLSEVIGGEIFRSAGVPAARVVFARVELNGRDLGFYTLVEAASPDFLTRYFKDAKGRLYEGPAADVHERLEQDSGEISKDQSDLQALAAAAAEKDPVLRFKKLSTLLDMDRFISFVAAEIFTGHHMGYALARDNYRIYHDVATDQMTFLPHGLDVLFEKPASPLVPEWKGLVAKAVLEAPEGRRRYHNRMTALIATSFSAETLQKRIDELAGVIRAEAKGDTARGWTFDEAVTALRERVAARCKFVTEELNRQK